MSDLSKSVRVGALVLATLVGVAMAVRFVDEGIGAGSGYRVHALFDDAQGLVPKSRVVIAGISVGTIESIRLQDGRARVDIRIREDIALGPEATVAQRRASILGETLLTISPGARAEPRLGEGDRIKAASVPSGTDDVIKTVASVANSVERVTRQMERSFGTDEAGRQMASALESLTEALAAVNRTVTANEEVVTRTLQNVEGITEATESQLQSILTNIDVLSAELLEIVRSRRGDVEGSMERVSRTVETVERSAVQLESVLADVKRVSERTAAGEGTLGLLTQDDALADEVQGVATGISDVVGGMSRLQTIVRLRSEYNFLANTFKNYVGLRLQPREDRYYLFELINDPRGLTAFTQRQVRVSPPPAGEPQFYQESISETRDAFRFSLIFAKRIHFASFRFGILESTGGLGVDLHLLNESFELNNDIFAIGEQEYARLRSKLGYEVLKHLWLMGGVDDILNENRDFFLGAQLRFDDQDLKTILPFVSGLGGG